MVELIAILAIAAVILVLLVLQLTGSRESARRIECEDQLRNLHVALDSYALAHGHFPAGTENPTGPVRSQADGYHHNWITGILPELDQQALYERIDFDYGVYADPNQPIANTQVPGLLCPSSAKLLSPNATSYAGVTSSMENAIDQDNDGMFLLNRTLRPADATDGVSHVFLVGEKAFDYAPALPWNSGTRASLRNTGHAINANLPAAPIPGNPPAVELPDADPLFVGGFSSGHAGGAYMMMVDGAFQFYTNDADPVLLQQLAGRADQTDTPPLPSINADDSSANDADTAGESSGGG